MTALTAYLTSTTDTLLTTAKQITAVAPSSETSVANTCKKLTGWGELFTVTGQTAWPALGSIGAPSGEGALWDVTTLEKQRIAAGTWTPKVKLVVSSGLTAAIHVRAYKRSSAGVYTAIGDWSTAATSITTTATVFSPTATSVALMDFAVGDKLYLDYWLDITVAGGSTTGTVSIFENGGANDAVATPGYAPTPVTASGAALLSLSGAGAVAVGLTASGSAALALAGHGAAVVKQAATGSGHLATLGSGAAIVRMPASGAGHLTAAGSGAAALRVGASGTGHLALTSSGAAVLHLAAAGNGALNLSATATALIRLATGGSGHLTAAGLGAAAVVVRASGTGPLSLAGSATASVSGLVSVSGAGVLRLAGTGLAIVGAGDPSVSGSGWLALVGVGAARVWEPGIRSSGLVVAAITGQPGIGVTVHATAIEDPLPVVSIRRRL
jgi:hypothetical protein